VINKWVSLIILGLFVPSAQIGIYRVAVQMAVLADFGLQVVNPVIAPQIARLYALGDQRRLQRLATNSARMTLLVNVIITMGFLLLGRQFIRLFFGTEFSPAFPALLILLVGGVINSLTGAVAFFLNMTGHEKETLLARLVATFVSIILTFLLSPVWGILGAAVGSSIPLIVWNVMLWDLARKRLKVNSLAFGKDVV
jgi:O-antigen/teichoic acid export membrane protein